MTTTIPHTTTSLAKTDLFRPSLDERIAIVERTCEYLATKESVAEAKGMIEATNKVVARMQWEVHVILILCIAIFGGLLTVITTILRNG